MMSSNKRSRYARLAFLWLQNPTGPTDLLTSDSDPMKLKALSSTEVERGTLRKLEIQAHMPCKVQFVCSSTAEHFPILLLFSVWYNDEQRQVRGSRPVGPWKSEFSMQKPAKASAGSSALESSRTLACACCPLISLVESQHHKCLPMAPHKLLHSI